MTDDQIKAFSELAAKAVADHLLGKNGSFYGTGPSIEKVLKSFLKEHSASQGPMGAYGIALAIKKEFGRKPAVAAAMELLDAGVAEQELVSAGKEYGVADSDWIAVQDAMRDIRRVRAPRLRPESRRPRGEK